MKLSVIVCTYNNAEFLKQSLACLAAQSVPDFELIVVDDGSTDSTSKVVQNFARCFHSCRYLRKSHTGLADSRNYGIENAHGTHIAYLDADDFWSPRYVEEISRTYAEHPCADLVLCDGLRVSAAGAVLGSMLGPEGDPIKGPIVDGRQQLAFALASRPTSITLARDVFLRVGNYDVRFAIGHDQHWVMRAVASSAHCVCLNRKLVLYRHHDNSLTSQQDVAFIEFLAIVSDMVSSGILDGAALDDAQELAEKWLLRLIARYPPKRSHQLVTIARQLIGGNLGFIACQALLGARLLPLLRIAEELRESIRRLGSDTNYLDLRQPPDILFAAVEKHFGDRNQ